MPILHAILLGLVQGLTEFLPVSSSGHLALVPWLFGWDHFGGDGSLENAFDVALHLGTLLGAVVYLRADVVRYGSAGIGWLAARDRWWAMPARPGCWPPPPSRPACWAW